MTIPATTGAYQCLTCLQWIPHGVTHMCAGSPPFSNIPLTAVTYPIYGWTCPVCGNGCAPWLSTCPGPHRGTFMDSVAGRARSEESDG